MHTLKSNCKGESTVGKANKGIKVEKNKTVFKKLKLKIIKNRKEKKKGRRKNKGGKKENSTELQKPNTEAEAYNNNKNCD